MFFFPYSGCFATAKQLSKINHILIESNYPPSQQYLIQQEALLTQQQTGRPSQLLDDRFGFSSSSSLSKNNKSTSTGVGTGHGIASSKSNNSHGNGDGKEEGLKVKITPELMREVFEEFEVVERIYAENVGVGNGAEVGLRIPAYPDLA